MDYIYNLRVLGHKFQHIETPTKLSMVFESKGRISLNCGMNSFELFLKNRNKILEWVWVEYRL